MPIIKGYLKLSFLCLALLAAILGLIASQPYDDHDLRALLLPDGCPRPCFLEIRPGRTTVDSALELLRNHQWVDSASVELRPGVEISWLWNGQQSALLDSSLPGRLVLSADAALIEQVWVGIRLEVGQIHLLLGKPPFFTVGVSQFNRAQARLTVNEYYVGQYFYTHAETTCPLHLSSFMRLPVQQITIFNERVSGGDLFARMPIVSALNASDYRVC